MAGSIYDELIKFSTTLKPWQQDALRRHTITAELLDEDIAVLTDIAFEANLKGNISLDERVGEETTFSNPAVIPFTQKHVPSSSSVAPPVALSKVQHIQGVNRLRPGTDLTLKPVGLNIIFGLNGVGKSGYTRILKSCCHAKAKEDIKGDVFQDEHPEPRAKIWYQLGGSDLEHEWNPKEDSDNADLPRVAVYDSQSARVHVGKNPTELSFTPAGLELITSLTASYEAVSQNAKNRIAVLKAEQVPTIAVDALSPRVRNAVDYLGKAGAVELVTTLGTLTDEEKQDLTTLPGEISNLKGNSKSAREGTAKVASTNYRTQGNRIKLLAEKISNGQVEALRSIWIRLRGIDAEQSTEIHHDFTTEPVPGVLSNRWKSMWDAVQDFAREEQDLADGFPADNSEYCLLCHQTLSPEAQDRLNKFKTAMAKDLDAEKQRLTRQMTAIIAGIRTAVSSDNINADMLAVLEEDHQEDITKFRANLVLVNHLLEAPATGLLASNEFIDEITAPFLDDEAINPTALIHPIVAEQLGETATLFETIANGFDAKVLAIQGESEDGSDIVTKEARLLELQERSKVAGSTEALQDQHNRLIYIDALDKVVAETATRGLSLKSKSLVTDYIERIATDFTANLRMMENLSPNAPQSEARLRVKLVQSVNRGVVNIGFNVDGATSANERANGVLSEGELRAVTVAAFLADVTSSDDGSAIIFDDPMTSLDHDFQTKIAIRLVEEAHHRQVIIFTHNVSFVGSLWHEGVEKDIRRQTLAQVANPTKVEAYYVELTRHPEEGAGLQVAGTGTPTQGFKNLLTKLEHEVIPGARKHYSGADMDLSAYANDCVRFATDLRNAWEYAVEEIMIGGVVARNQPAVRTGMLSSLVVVTQADVGAIDTGMDVNSYYVHSTGAGNQVSLPTPADMMDRVTMARNWASDFNSRKRASQRTS